MTLLRLSPTALARCRFAISPFAETLGALITLHRPSPPPWHASWHAAHQAAYRAWLASDPVAAGVLALVAATKWMPDFATVPPGGGMRTRLSAELAEVSSFSDDHVRATVADSVAASWAPPSTEWLALEGLGPRIASMFRTGWALFVEPGWPRRRAVLERDVLHRAGLLAVYGWKQTVESMRDRPIWVGDNAIRFSDQDIPDRWIGDEGLIFVPRTTSGGWWTCERPPEFALVYPARGSAVPSAESASLDALLGAGRARVVRELVLPSTSSQLAVVLGVSLGTVSSHLAVLRSAGVVTRGRVGRSVVYRLTDRGSELLALWSAE